MTWIWCSPGSLPLPGDDEDGVILPPVLVTGTSPNITVDGGPSGGTLDAWIDFNGNGVFDHPAEHLFGGVSMTTAPGPGLAIPITVPAGATPESTYARFRLHGYPASLPPTGPDTRSGNGEGEVEDYPMQIIEGGNLTIMKESAPEDGTDFDFSNNLPLIFSLMWDIGVNGGAGLEICTSSCTFGGFSSNGGGFDFPFGVAVNATDQVYVADRNNNRIQKFTQPAFSLDDANPDDSDSVEQSITWVNLLPVTYAITEALPSGWQLDGAICTGGSDSGNLAGQTLSVVIGPGENVTCTFTNGNVEIDIKPGSDPNSINCNNPNETISVAILSTSVASGDGLDFDATTVNHTTVMFEGASETHTDKKTGEPRRHEEDVDEDGDTDLLLHFRLGDTNLDCNSTEGTLTGQTFGGEDIGGTDAVRMVSE